MGDLGTLSDAVVNAATGGQCVRTLADAARAGLDGTTDGEFLQDLDLETCGEPVVWPDGWDSSKARTALGS